MRRIPDQLEKAAKDEKLVEATGLALTGTSVNGTSSGAAQRRSG